MLIRKSTIGVLFVFLVFFSVGCSSNQDVKDVWKGTKGWWYSNVSVPASIDYDAKGEMSEYKSLLAESMIGIDVQLSNVEKLMSNADKPPTNEWVQALFSRFPWLNGFTGVKADGTILGQVPAMPLKPLDFFPLLEEDKKQNIRALRGHVQNTPMGPEVFLATPLYDAHTFLGVVSIYFDMRELLQFSETPDELVIVSPQAVLWAGKYNFASTPMAGIAWDSIALKESSGTVTNANGSFYWTVRYFGNLPIVFAVAVSGNFEEVYNARTGPIDSAGFVEPTYVAPDEDDVDVDDTKSSESTDDTGDAPTEATDSAATPSPIYPDQPDSDADTSSDTDTDSDTDTSTEASPAETSVSRPSPIYPDQPDSADSTSVDGDNRDDDDEAAPSEADDKTDAADSISVDSDDSDDDADDQGSGYSKPSPFGPN